MKLLKNITCAPKSTILGCVILSLLTVLHTLKLIDKDSYGLLAVPTLTFCFTDLLGENKKKADKDRPETE